METRSRSIAPTTAKDKCWSSGAAPPVSAARFRGADAGNGEWLSSADMEDHANQVVRETGDLLIELVKKAQAQGCLNQPGSFGSFARVSKDVNATVQAHELLTPRLPTDSSPGNGRAGCLLTPRHFSWLALSPKAKAILLCLATPLCPPTPLPTPVFILFDRFLEVVGDGGHSIIIHDKALLGRPRKSPIQGSHPPVLQPAFCFFKRQLEVRYKA